MVQTTGSQGAARNYVINVLDTGAPDDGVDVLSVFGVDGSEADGATDDIFLLRRITAIPSEAATAPAFVALLHGIWTRRAPPAPTAVCARKRCSASTTTPTSMAGLQVYGGGGNDYFAVDDNSAITTSTVAAARTSSRSARSTARSASRTTCRRPTPFDTIATTRGYVSRGVSVPLVAQGGSGNDSFIVYSNKAELRLEGDAGDDLFIVRAFALAQDRRVTAIS